MRERRTNETAASAPVPGRGAEAGFSLLEVSVAIVVLVIGLMGLAQAMMAAYRMERTTEEQKAALRFASSHLERIRGMSYAELLRPAPDGYWVDTTWPSYYQVGASYDFDADGKKDDYFYRMYYANPSLTPFTYTGVDSSGATVTKTIDRYDPMLQGLRGQYGDYTYTALILFREPAQSLSGLPGGSGLIATVWVRWTGSSGPAEMRLSTFVGK